MNFLSVVWEEASSVPSSSSSTDWPIPLAKGLVPSTWMPSQLSQSCLHLVSLVPLTDTVLASFWAEMPAGEAAVDPLTGHWSITVTECVHTWGRHRTRASPGLILPECFPGGSLVESACHCRRSRFDPWSGKTAQSVTQLGPCTTATEPTCWKLLKFVCVLGQCSASGSHRNKKPTHCNGSSRNHPQLGKA